MVSGWPSPLRSGTVKVTAVAVRSVKAVASRRSAAIWVATACPASAWAAVPDALAVITRAASTSTDPQASSTIAIIAMLTTASSSVKPRRAKQCRRRAGPRS